MSYIHGYDPDTLRELVDANACRERPMALGAQRSLPALPQRAWPRQVLHPPEAARAGPAASGRGAPLARPPTAPLRARYPPPAPPHGPSFVFRSASNNAGQMPQSAARTSFHRLFAIAGGNGAVQSSAATVTA